MRIRSKSGREFLLCAVAQAGSIPQGLPVMFKRRLMRYVPVDRTQAQFLGAQGGMSKECFSTFRISAPWRSNRRFRFGFSLSLALCARRICPETPKICPCHSFLALLSCPPGVYACFLFLRSYFAFTNKISPCFSLVSGQISTPPPSFSFFNPHPAIGLAGGKP